MAARIDLRHLEETRKKIQTSQLINRLQGHANGENEMSNTQIAAAKILLGKAMPDLQAVTISGDAENPLAILEIAGKQLDAKLARVVAGATAESSTDTDGTGESGT